MATHSNILAWESSWTEELGGYSPWGRKESDKPEHTCTHTHIHTRALFICDKSLKPPNSTLKTLLSAQQPFSGGSWAEVRGCGGGAARTCRDPDRRPPPQLVSRPHTLSTHHFSTSLSPSPEAVTHYLEPHSPSLHHPPVLPSSPKPVPVAPWPWI